MPASKTSPLDKILGRLDQLDADNLAILVQRLARERSLLETVFNTLREGILIMSPQGLIEYANQSAASLLAFELKEVGKLIFWQLVPELMRTLPISEEGVYLGEWSASREIHINYPELRCIRLYLVPFDYSEPAQDQLQHHAFAAILNDITQEKRSTEEAIESEKIDSLFQLAGGVAHELGNPLNSLTIHLQLLQRQIAKECSEEEGKVKKSLNVCLREVERLDGIISHFLEAVRPQHPDFKDVDLIAALEDVLELQGQELSDAGIKVDVAIMDSPPVPPIISGDWNQIKQVYFNLLKNARQAMEGGGTIKVEAHSDDKFVYIVIADTGSGIDKENLRKIFDPYFTTKLKGHGLGMMIVMRIMNDHQARIGVDSDPGVGTVITLQFPKKHQNIPKLQTSARGS